MKIRRFALLLLVLLAFPVTAQEPPVNPSIWPSVPSPLPRDPEIEKAVDALLAKMSLEEKVGQVIQASITTVTPEDVKRYHLGSVLNGGGGWPGDVRKARPQDWLARADSYYVASMDTSDGKAAIPIIWGSDAVHGHSNIVGATLFPHNIGLGATRNYELIRKIGEVTAAEMAITGIDWDFSPVVAVARDERWGRTYESYSEHPSIVAAAANAMTLGLQGAAGSPGFLGPGRVLATAKHYLGDGGTAMGKDQGDTQLRETELRDLHGPGYVTALGAGAQTVMISQSGWQGWEMHAHRGLLTDVLKGRMGFDGFIVGDWNGHGQIPGCTNGNCAEALNAGLDMFMVPDDWKELYANTLAQARSGAIPAARLDDAVRRILRVKLRAGLFTAGKPSARPLGGQFDRLGSAEHRAVARQAVRESLVLLKNDGTLPLSPKGRILVAGDGADDIAKQSGGWTLSWQGTGNTNADFPGATSIWRGIRDAVEAGGGSAVLSEDGTYTEKPDAAIVIYGEDPYAEWEGDRKHLVYEDRDHLTILNRLRVAGVPVVSVFLSGRPLWVNPFLNASSAFVAAWLPGTEGAGIADVLFRAADGKVRHDFMGQLSFSWPKRATQLALNHGDSDYDPLFPLGFGLTYSDRETLGTLPADMTGVFRGRRFFSSNPIEPWKLELGKGITERQEPSGRRVLEWPGGADAAVVLRADEAADLSGDAKLTLSVDLLVERRPEKPVLLGFGGATIDISEQLRAMPVGIWRTLSIPLRCFAEAGAKLARVDVPFRISSEGTMILRLGDVELTPDIDGAACPKKATGANR